MQLLLKPILKKLLANATAQNKVRGTSKEIDFEPVVKFFNPCGAATWLITELDPEDNDTMFGLCDLGMGFPELGNVSLKELSTAKGKLGLGMERDRHWKAKKKLSEYAEEARAKGRIVA